MYKLVIVEDEHFIRRWLQVAVDYASLGIEIVGVASHGQEGMELIQQYRPDIVLTDITMPIMNAFMMFEATVNISYEKIILSGYNDFDNAKRAMKYGVRDFISKPICVGDLTECLRGVTEKLGCLKIAEQPWAVDYDSLVRSLNLPQQHLLLRQVLDWIHVHYHSRFTIADMSKELGYSESYLYRIIKEHLPMTLNEYILRYRLKIAIELMATDEQLKIYELAEQVGFSDYKYFGKVFKKQFGLSPKEFQEQSVRISK